MEHQPYRVSKADTEAVLSILKSGPLPGSAIAQAMSARGVMSFQRAEAALYILLHTMERQKLIRGRIRDVEYDMERRFYQLTPRGKALASNLLDGIPPAPFHAEEISERDRSSIQIIRLRRWCSDATLGIRVSPDKELVGQEIFDHIYDRMASLIRQGMDSDSAERTVMEAMGSALEVSAALGQLHRPFWTLALRYARRVMAVLAVLTLFCYGLHYLDTVFFRNTIVDFDPAAPPALSGTHELLWRIDPDASAGSDGYRVNVTRTALWSSTSLDGDTRPLLNIQLKITNPLPWAEPPDFGDWVWARDSLGNIYLCGGEDSPAMEPAIQAIQYHTAGMTYMLDLWIYRYVSQDAQWIELHYDRAGRDMTLHIDLTGGDQP